MEIGKGTISVAGPVDQVRVNYRSKYTSDERLNAK